ncbi:kelch repeat and BTB domain-containing protein 8-like isoform X2 [Branchiostoma floridae]|uniref:Kelch repeat and BTB domain-containing protein 8-like isoform X2 n=1 Tax=Branchiostoma floridae TaxID=7739 RepID=A0A9J7LTG8_BRAFL|nr:kelch repeat and BTB domain-containing protein 8-like isoform X2 [Branchiostoma floridae]
MAAADQETHASGVRPRSYQDESYLHGFLGNVDDLQKNGVLQDVVLEVEGRRFPCHRLVLSAASPYFRAMFTSDMAESRQKTVVLQGLEMRVFEEILSYIYSGTLHVSLDKVQPLYHAADLLQLDYVRDTCSSYMAMNVERSTCVDLYKFADVFSMDNVRKACLRGIARHFTEVASSEEFCSLSVNQLTEIISHDELDVKEETTVWEAVVRWVQHSREDRLHHLPSILPHIRFNLLTPYNMVAILDHPLVREDPGRSAIRNVVKGTSNLKKRFGMETLEMALLFADRTKEMLWINPEEGKYIRCHYDISPFIGAATSDNDIFILAEGSRKKHALFKYNHVGNKWEQKSSLRRDLVDSDDLHLFENLIEVDGHLFYLLLTSSVVVLKKYNQHTNKWQTCSTPQHDGRFNYCAAVSCNQHIYLFKDNDIQCYNPRADQWCRKTGSNYIPKENKAVAMGTEIFCTDMFFDKTLVYDTEADSWHEHPGWQKTGYGIENITLFALENKLHAVVDGWVDPGTDGARRVDQVLLYDRCEGVWKELSVLPEGRWFMYVPMFPVARMYLPYLNTQGAASTQGTQSE